MPFQNICDPILLMLGTNRAIFPSCMFVFHENMKYRPCPRSWETVYPNAAYPWACDVEKDNKLNPVGVLTGKLHSLHASLKILRKIGWLVD